MGSTLRVAAVGLLGLMLAACHTIVEEMPTAPAPVVVAPIVPVVIVPVPVPSPVVVVRGPNPGPITNPIPTVGPFPTSAPPSAPPPSGGSDIPDNNEPIVKVFAKVRWIECQGQIIAEDFADEAPVGCRIALDATPKGASNRPTQARSTPRWTYSDTGIISVSGNSAFNPVLKALSPGNLSLYVTIDGVASNDVHVRIVN